MKRTYPARSIWVEPEPPAGKPDAWTFLLMVVAVPLWFFMAAGLLLVGAFNL